MRGNYKQDQVGYGYAHAGYDIITPRRRRKTYPYSYIGTRPTHLCFDRIQKIATGFTSLVVEHKHVQKLSQPDTSVSTASQTEVVGSLLYDFHIVRPLNIRMGMLDV